ncbi:TPA: alpha/beta fold hydrolase [Burkholderia aenigmatica]|uniref:alpha/beta fold hydrolase n=1 Tax=Burkholderia sp. AU45251 TaxID=3059204 RepID=UPI00264B1709|nr:alpha/beta hydrolase [Burkholderia sp. AU45251]HDR9487672.1 alpha/beta fold hydrolase [Burkholderia aenigmatica]MDN7520553.1 alpha/beta hydrolase [Burkholderia sp. AU45251]HDR9519450.1 alpha/beta fold hydrolase [Burkholderia aenigmatica]HDR9596480.1 alpha/beta fold hydrolase [Burkholderia aenigmatica]HDR9603857.1 alpha/beta fold hydrolase [Burkholderia aenigmatica]
MALTQAQTSRTVETRDWQLHYHEAGSGHPVILLHGSGPGATGWSNFSGNIDALAKQFHVFAVDMPGWGQSDSATVEQLDHVDAAIQFMDALGIERAAFVGNSMGGQTSLRLATEHPERITHLVTMGPPVGRMPTLFGAGDGPSEGLKVLIQAYRDPSPEHMRRLVEIMVYDKARFATPELCQARSDAALLRPEHLSNYVAGLPAGAPLPKWVKPELLPAIKTPTLLIHGRDDRVVSFETSLYLLANIPDSRLVLLNRCGHWAMIEHPDEFNRLVADFIANA